MSNSLEKGREGKDRRREGKRRRKKEMIKACPSAIFFALKCVLKENSDGL
jgi:hypothetical protein